MIRSGASEFVLCSRLGTFIGTCNVLSTALVAFVLIFFFFFFFMSNKRSIDDFKEYYLTVSVIMMICYDHFCYKEQADTVIGGVFPTLLFL